MSLSRKVLAPDHGFQIPVAAPKRQNDLLIPSDFRLLCGDHHSSQLHGLTILGPVNQPKSRPSLVNFPALLHAKP
jgi:hypothetical protein